MGFWRERCQALELARNGSFMIASNRIVLSGDHAAIALRQAIAALEE
jgi:hypothetical protein